MMMKMVAKREKGWRCPLNGRRWMAEDGAGSVTYGTTPSSATRHLQRR